MIKLNNVSKYYSKNGIVASGLSKVSLEFKMGEFVAITGESGSGKSTLLNICSGLDSYEEGEMYINGEETSHYLEVDYENYRRKYIGNIFQNFNLINSYTVYQNIELVLLFNGCDSSLIKDKILDIIKEVDLVKFKNTKVSKLSGGQKQRVAIARALAKETPIIIADEPTGNLDSKSARSILKMLHEISKDKLVIVVTHNYDQVEEYVTRKIRMHDGKVLEDKKICDNEEVESHFICVKDITFKSQLKLMFRNVFNVIPKFVLLTVVFLLLIVAVMSKYSFDREQEYTVNSIGDNYNFQDTSLERVLFKKSDGSLISESDYLNISKMNNVDYIVKNDFALDQWHGLTDMDNRSYWGKFVPIERFSGSLDYGELPNNEDEIVIALNESDAYYDSVTDVLGKEVYVDNSNGIKSNTYKIVGIQLISSWNTKFYGSEVFANDIVTVDTEPILNTNISGNNVVLNNRVGIDNSLNSGEVIINENYCNDCVNDDISINNDTNNKDINLVISNTFEYIVSEEYYEFDLIIKMNIEDYKSLVNYDGIQGSLFVNDVKNIKFVVNELESLGYDTFVMKDSLVFSDFVIVFNNILTIVLWIVLFFISYFVIKLILKSRNVYFSTIRILGASKSKSRDLLVGELLMLMSFIYGLFILCCECHILSGFLFKSVCEYVVWYQYIYVYIVLSVMIYLIGIKTANKLFKSSVITTLNEEV